MTDEQKLAAKRLNETLKAVSGLCANGGLGLVGYAIGILILAQPTGWAIAAGATGLLLLLLSIGAVRYIELEE